MPEQYKQSKSTAAWIYLEYSGYIGATLELLMCGGLNPQGIFH